MVLGLLDVFIDLNYPLKLIKTVPTTFFVGRNDPFANKDDAKWAYD